MSQSNRRRIAVSPLAVASVGGEHVEAEMDAAHRSSALSQRSLLLLSGIVLLGALLRTYQLGAGSLWHDELFSEYFQSLGVHFLWTGGFALESTPPLYYSILSLWTPFAGTTEAGLRSLSALGGVLGIPAVYLLARELFSDRRHALLAALLFAIAPTDLYYAQETRVYTLLALDLCFCLYGLARFLQPEARFSPLVLYAVTALIAVYLHVTAVVFVVAVNLVVLGWLVIPPRNFSWRHLWRWAAANLAIAVLSLPLAWLIFSPAVMEDLAHLKPMTFHWALFTFRDLLIGDEVPGTPLGYPVVLLFALGLASSLVARHLWTQLRGTDRRALWLLAILPVVFVALCALLSLHRQILVARALSWLWVPLSLLLAHAMLAGARRGVLVGVTALMFAVGLYYHMAWPAWNRDDWRGVLAAVAGDMKAADMVVIGPDTLSAGIAYYAPFVTNLHHMDEPAYHTVSNTFIPQRMGVPTITKEQVVAAVRAGQHVVLVSRGEDLDVDRWLEGQTPKPRRAFNSACGPDICFRVLVW